MIRVKKIFFLIIIIIVFMPLSYGENIKLGKAYKTNIDTYIDNCLIESYNYKDEMYVDINDLNTYGYDIRWNKKLNEYNIIKSYEKEKERFLLFNKADYAYFNQDGWYKNWINSFSPEFNYTASSIGTAVPVKSLSDGSVIINFKKRINKKYMNENFIKVYSKKMDVSDKFKYNFDQNLLKLELKEDKFFKKEADFTLFLLEGIRTLDNEIMATPLKYQFKIKKNEDNNLGYIGDIYKTKITAIVNNSDNIIYNLNDKELIPLDSLGLISWDPDKRIVNLERNNDYISNKYMFKNIDFYNISKPIYDGKYKEWIEDTIPKMNKSKGIDLINNNENYIEIIFNKKIPKEYISKNYIKIYHGSSNESDKFRYDYNEDTGKLKLILNDTSIKMLRFSYLYDNNKVIDNKNLLGRNYDVFIIEGLKSEDGETLDTSLRFTGGILWNKDN